MAIWLSVRWMIALALKGSVLRCVSPLRASIGTKEKEKKMTTLELKAPPGKFRVVGVDTFDGTDWIYGDYDTIEEATSLANSKGGEMLKTHVYDDAGKHCGGAGRF